LKYQPDELDLYKKIIMKRLSITAAALIITTACFAISSSALFYAAKLRIKREGIVLTPHQVPTLKGTSWGVVSIYRKGATPRNNQVYPTYLFCNDGHWEFQTNFFQRGTYSQQGAKLTTIGDGADKLKAVYKLTWFPVQKYLEMDEDGLIIRMVYQAKAKC
jgi:hypothetical protein